jgi:hypothetical protein
MMSAPPTPSHAEGPQVDKRHYTDLDYLKAGRMASLAAQYREIMVFQPRSVLEVGRGAGLLQHLLQNSGVRVRAADIDRSLAPDVCASVTRLPFRDRSFDVVGCFQVLEHLPYERFIPALGELARVARRAVVLSVPDYSLYLQFGFHIPGLGDRNAVIPIPVWVPGRKNSFDGQHHWEIGWKGRSLRSILRDMSRAKLAPVKWFRLRENMYHRFFVIERP